MYLVLPGVFIVSTALYPAFELVRLSISKVGTQNLIGTWPSNGLENFRSVVTSEPFRSAAWRSCILTCVLLATELVVGFIAALWLSHPGKVSQIAQSIMILGWALPPIITGTAWKFLLQSSGPINAVLGGVGIGNVPWLSSANIALWSTILVTVWAQLPFSALVLKAALLGVPAEVLEAAQVDGANTRRVIFSVLLPQIRTAIATLAVLIIVYGFGSSFAFIYVVTEGGPGTATTTLPYLGYVDAFTDFEFGSAGAIAVISILVVSVFVVGYLRTLRKEADYG